MLAPRKKLWSTPSTAIDIALRFADLGAEDVVYDVGCGDGRVLIQLASSSIPLPSHDSTSRPSEDDHTNHEKIRTNCEQQSLPDPDPIDISTSKQQHHYCHRFVGIEIDPNRAQEAQANIQSARQSNQIPAHVTIDVKCVNALEVDYSEATVCFLYLVPRGLRLIKPLLWPCDRSTASEGRVTELKVGGVSPTTEQQFNNGQDGSNSDSDAIFSQSRANSSVKTTQQSISVQQSQQSLAIESAPPMETSEEAGLLQNNQNNHSKAVTVTKPRRIITYMAGFEGEKYVTKEHCRVEHQEGALWPVYLYHVNN